VNAGEKEGRGKEGARGRTREKKRGEVVERGERERVMRKIDRGGVEEWER